MKYIINTRNDLEHIAGTEEYFQFLKSLYGSRIKKMDVAEYPENYNRSLAPEDEGYVASQIVEVVNLKEIERFGFTVEELEVLLDGKME